MKVRRHAAVSSALGGASPAVVISVAVLLLAGAALALYDRSTAGRILPGVAVAGVDVGEMPRGEAIEVVRDRTTRDLLRDDLSVHAREETWHVVPAELGATVDIEALVDRALALNEGVSWPERVFRRLFDRPIGSSLAARIEVSADPLAEFLQSVAEQVEISPVNARVAIEDGEVVLRPPKPGWSLRTAEARRMMARALRAAEPEVELPLERLQPEVTRNKLGYTIVVRISELELYLYDGLRLEKRYPVATGMPGYETPEGEWTIINKRVDPTWVNPATEGWGADLPPVIGPGPGNPLGTRALDLNVPGIRIHGTYDSDSIGTYASHGCIRMYIEDSEELFDIVPVGTRVLVGQ